MFRHLPPVASYLTGKDIAVGIKTLLFRNTAVVEQFAASIARYAGVKAAFLTSSGRSALYLVLKALAQRAPTRHEVVLPAYTCPILVKMIQAARLVPRLCDVSPQTLDFDRDHLHKLVNERTLAIIPVHPYGIPQEVRDVIILAEKVGATVIEDAAQALGARLDGRMVGTWGHFGLTSLGPGKALSTGSGGVMLVNDDKRSKMLSQIWQDLSPGSSLASLQALLQLSALAIALRPIGWWLITQLRLDRVDDQKSEEGFRVQGFTVTQAGVGQSLLGRLDVVNAARRAQATQLITALNGARTVRFPQIVARAEPIYIRLPVLVAGKNRREELYAALQAQGIGVRKMYGQPLSAIFPHLAETNYPGATAVAAQLLTLPTHRFVTVRDIAQVVTTIHRFDAPSTFAWDFSLNSPQ